MPLQNGTILNSRYRILSILGQGGFGAVYRAADMNLKHPCAVKENLDTSPQAQRQFEKEATILANLSHPNLPRVLDHFLIPGQGQYLVMDFIEGEDLHNLVARNGPVSQDQALDWIGQIAGALNYLHGQHPPVIHRDIKPANIRVTPDGRAFLVDFGLVKIYDPHLRTTVGARAVTPGYSPPEQYGQGNTDVRTDVYALGATLYTLLTGQEPQESVQRVVNDQLLPVHAANVQVQPSLSQSVGKAMHLQPSQRYPSVVAFENAMRNPTPQFATQTLQMSAPTTLAPTPQVSSVTKRSWIWPVVGFALIAIVILFVLTNRKPQPTPEPVVAVRADRPTQVEVPTEGFTESVANPSTYTPLPTYTSFPTYTPLPPTKPSEPTSTAIPPTHTPQPPTYTPTPLAPEFTARENMFCRDGPGSEYEDHTMVMTGDTVPVYARWSNNWLLVGIDQTTTRTKCCWIGGNGDLNVSISSIQTINYLVDRITCQPK